VVLLVFRRMRKGVPKPSRSHGTAITKRKTLADHEAVFSCLTTVAQLSVFTKLAMYSVSSSNYSHSQNNERRRAEVRFRKPAPDARELTSGSGLL
jgi:hypothetical protein